MTLAGNLEGLCRLRFHPCPQAAWKAASTFYLLPAGGLKSRLYVLHTSRGRLRKPPLRATSCPQAAWNAASTFYLLPASGLERRLYVLHTSSGRLEKPPLRSISCPQAAWQAARKREAKGVTLAG